VGRHHLVPALAGLGQPKRGIRRAPSPGSNDGHRGGPARPATVAAPTATGDRALAPILQIGQVDLAAAPVTGWAEHLAAWVARRPAHEPLNGCVVALSAPLDALAKTIRHAVLDEFTTGQQLDRDLDHHRNPDQHRHLSIAGAITEDSAIPNGDAVFYGITQAVARMLDWLIRHHPTIASQTIGEIIGEAQRRLDIPDEVSEHSIRTALVLDSDLAPHVRDNFLDLVFTPGPSQ
jgi:hypothetical protein